VSAPGAGRARAFVALALGKELGVRLGTAVERALGAGERDFRLPRAEGLHLTLFFLGAIERARLATIEGLLRSALAGRAAPALALRGTGAFPGRGRERVLWAGVCELPPPGRLDACRQGVLSAVRRAGFDTSEEERQPFRPHVTVARPRERGQHVPAAFYELALDEPWTPRTVTLFESEPGGGPPRYRALAAIELAGT
jgi:2'-5' RNA ligase